MPPSEYLDRFFYDSCTYSGPALRFLIDAVGIDRVVLGTDYPAPMVQHDAVNWVNGLPELSAGEKQAILSGNPAWMPGLVVTAVGGDSLRWGVIGIGNIVRTTMAPAMVAEPAVRASGRWSAGTRVGPMSSPREFGARFAYTSYDEMLANPEVDAVFIATPNVFHADQVVAAAGAAKHVFCDKPLGNSVSDARRALDACASAGVSLGVNFHNRHLPWVRDVSGLIADGIIGEVRVVQLQVASGPRRYDNWRADPAIAGLGSVHNVGVHGLDFLRVLLQSEPVEVMAMFDQAPGVRGCGDAGSPAVAVRERRDGPVQRQRDVARPPQRHRDLRDRRSSDRQVVHPLP